MTTECPRSKAARFPSVRRAASMSMLLTAGACGSDYGDPGRSFRVFEDEIRTNGEISKVLVMIVDDRQAAGAAQLRANLPAMVRDMGTTVLHPKEGWRDPAAWTPLDVRVVIVPASSSSMDGVVLAGLESGLRAETGHATLGDVEALTLAVQRQVGRMSIISGVPFRPLERARDVTALLEKRRAPATPDEEALVASVVSPLTRYIIGVAVIASADDESEAPVEALQLSIDLRANVITPHGRSSSGQIDASLFPRLSKWMPSARFGCDENPLHQIFWTYCGGYQPRCDTPPIAESSPGLGHCYVEITSGDSLPCDPHRGWTDPTDAAGIRRPRVDAEGQRVCEMLPVVPAHMDACIGDPDCAACGSGWCLSNFGFPAAHMCKNPLPPRRMRFIGGALPVGGKVRFTCREPD